MLNQRHNWNSNYFCLRGLVHELMVIQDWTSTNIYWELLVFVGCPCFFFVYTEYLQEKRRFTHCLANYLCRFISHLIELLTGDRYNEIKEKAMLSRAVEECNQHTNYRFASKLQTEMMIWCIWEIKNVKREKLYFLHFRVLLESPRISQSHCQ